MTKPRGRWPRMPLPEARIRCELCGRRVQVDVARAVVFPADAARRLPEEAAWACPRCYAVELAAHAAAGDGPAPGEESRGPAGEGGPSW